jgi:hypothetical protein
VTKKEVTICDLERSLVAVSACVKETHQRCQESPVYGCGLGNVY